MSGTSLDGIDAAVIETDGEIVEAFGPAKLLPFTPAERAVLVAATEAAVRADAAGREIEPDRQADAIVIDAHLRAAHDVLGGDPVALVGFHGQTLLHRPERRFTVQIGDPAALADALGVPVIAQLRDADLAVGGEGAPLVPAYHAALADRLELPRPVAFLNIGGVANLTWLGPSGECIAFDTGPGNGMIDLMLQGRGDARYDEDGRLAARGQIDGDVLAALLSSDFFDRPGPKSLDRYDFPLSSVETLSTEDAAATLTAFTAQALQRAAASLPELPLQWLVCGGGRHNPTLMQMLREAVGDCISVDAFGLRGDFIEAEAMAFLAARSLRGLPITFPSTTGAPAPTTGGKLYEPQASLAA